MTASELQHGEVPFKVITDSMAAYAMSKFAIDAILVGNQYLPFIIEMKNGLC